MSEPAPRYSTLEWWTLWSGLSLMPLLPIGLLVGLGPTFGLCFGLHLIVLGVALIIALQELFSLLARSPGGGVGGAIAVAMVALCVGVLAAGAAPVTSTDALMHHLAVPKWWVAAGRIHEIPRHEWSYYPMLVNLAFTGFELLSAPGWCAGYHAQYLVLLVALVGLAVRDAGGDDGATSVALLVTASIPALLKLASVPMVDLALAVFSLLAVRFLVRARDEGDVRFTAAAGCALGLAMSTKYNGLLFAAAVMGAAVILFGARRVLHLAALSGAAAIVYLPWLVKNLWWTGNPLYPLMKSTFGGPALILPGAPRSVSPLLHRVLVYGESWLDVALLPARVLVSGLDGDPSRFDGILSPFLLLAFLVPLTTSSRATKLLYGGVGTAYLVLALALSAARVRYLAPAVPLLIVAAALVFARTVAVLRPGLRAVATGTVAVLSGLVGGAYVYNELLRQPVPAVLAGKITREQFLAAKIPEYPLIQLVNQELGPMDRVYLLATANRFYYFDIPVLSRGYYSLNETVSLLRRGRTADELLSYFTALGVTHLFVHTARFQSGLEAALDERQRVEWNRFGAEFLKGVASSGEYTLWHIRSTADTAKP